MKKIATGAFDPKVFPARAGKGRTLAEHKKNKRIFSQGDPAGAVYYLHKGKVKLSVVSRQGREAAVAILGAGDFFGEGCLAGQAMRAVSATTISECTILQMEKSWVERAMRTEPQFSERFVNHLLSRNIRMEEDLMDQLFNSSEKRLARVLLLMADFGEEGEGDVVIPKVSQQTLAEIVGTTRSRVSYFMNRFRRLGFIEYNRQLEIHSTLRNVVQRD